MRPGERGPFGEELGVLGGVPGGAVAHVGEPEDGMVAAVAEDVEGCLQSCVVWEQRMLVWWAFWVFEGRRRGGGEGKGKDGGL